MFFPKYLLVGLCIFSPFMACGDDGDHGHEEEQFTCHGNEDSLAVGSKKTSKVGHFEFTIVKAIPPVHYVQSNELIVSVKNSSGTLVDDAIFSNISPFTAQHDHGTPIPAKWEKTANAGEYRIYDINYIHRGPWRVDLDLKSGSVNDSLQWVFCIEELPGTPDAG